jgi:hypothetical protein
VTDWKGRSEKPTSLYICRVLLMMGWICDARTY